MARARKLGWWIALAIVLGAAAAAIGFWRTRAMPVTVEVIGRGRAIEAVYATGTVEPLQRIVVKARISERLATIDVKEGDAVVRGQRLARLEDSSRRAALSQGQSQLAVATTQASRGSPQLAALEAQARALHAQLDLARIELGRSESLAGRGAITQAELDSGRYKAAQLEAQARAADEQVRSSRLELAAARDQLTRHVETLAVAADELDVRAPADGVVLRKDVEPGESVAIGEPLFELADVRALRVDLHVDEADIAQVRDGGAAASEVALSFYAFPGQAFAGHVAEILPEPDPVRRSYTVRVTLDRPIAGLRVGMTAEANVIVRRKDGVLLLPIDALDGDAAWFVEDGHAVRRPVVLGVRDLTHAELVSGGQEGARVVVGPAVGRLSAGRRVSVEERPAR